MTAPCPHCNATASKPVPVAGEPNSTESWIIHAERCPGPARPSPRPQVDVDDFMLNRGRWSPDPDPALLGLPYGPKPAKPSTNGTTA